jgi:hypothetical protein
MTILKQLLFDRDFRRFFFKWAPHIFVGGLGLFGALGLAALSVLYLGLQDLSDSDRQLMLELSGMKSSMTTVRQDVAKNTAAVTTLTLDQSRSNSRIEISQGSISEILSRLAELVDLINANEASAKKQGRMTELEFLIKLDQLELRRIQRINRDNEATPTEIEIEAENNLIESINQQRRELESLRGY